MAAGSVLVLAVPWTREFFAFTLPEPVDLAVTVGIGVLAIGVLQVVLRIVSVGSRRVSRARA
jgi:hypothetical protein